MLNCHLCVCLRDVAEEESQTDRNNVEEDFHLVSLHVTDRKKLSLLIWQLVRLRDFQHLS